MRTLVQVLNSTESYVSCFWEAMDYPVRFVKSGNKKIKSRKSVDNKEKGKPDKDTVHLFVFLVLNGCERVTLFGHVAWKRLKYGLPVFEGHLRR